MKVMRERLLQLFDHDFFSFSGMFIVVIVVSLVVLLVASNFTSEGEQTDADCVAGELC